MSNLLKQSYRNFLLNSSSAHGVHSPFVYDLVTLCLRKKRETTSLYKKLVTSFPKTYRAKHIRILNDLFSYLGVNNYAHFCESEHGIDKLPYTSLLTKTSHPKADVIYVPQENFNLYHSTALLEELKHNGVLIIENPYLNEKVWEMIKEKNENIIVVDTYFFGFLFNRKQQAREHFKIRI